MIVLHKLKIYLSGKITGDLNYFEKFMSKQLELQERYPQHEIVNPALLNWVIKDASWKCYMDMCIPLLDACDAIYMLEDHLESKGAHIELAKASNDKKIVFYESCEKHCADVLHHTCVGACDLCERRIDKIG